MIRGDISLEDLKKIKQIIRLKYFYEISIPNGGLKSVWAVKPMDFEYKIIVDSLSKNKLLMVNTRFFSLD